MTSLAPTLGSGLIMAFPGSETTVGNWLSKLDINNLYKDYNYNLYSSQAGLRFTTTMGSSDLGFQYYYGKLPRPALSLNLDDFILTLPGSPDAEKIGINMAYNSYHQIGVDFARIIAGFNLRAEAGANITGDLDGTDGAVNNPALVWSLGFDRDLFWGINTNLQGTGSIRLFQDKLGKNPLTEAESGKDLTSTRITAILSKKFFRDELEFKTTGLWGIEDKDFLIIPAIVWSKNDVTAELSAGFFGGDKAGELGQYKDNGYVKVTLGYSF
jgi:hypothetical protein